MNDQTDPSLELKDRVALITGGSKGIGLATALRFVQAGARVAILARGEEALQAAAEEIEQAYGPGKTLAIHGDVRSEEAVVAAFEQTLRHFQRLDIVVNNAGAAVYAPVEETTLEMWQKMMDLNCTGYFLVAREAVRAFKQQGQGGVIVFVSSDNALKPSKNAVAYNVSKAAEVHMARSIADECGPAGIRVNTVLPGAVFGRSGFWTPVVRAQRAADHGLDPEFLEEGYKKKTALGVIILPEEVAEVILFLASDRSAKITGALISIDGGGAAAYAR